MPRGDRTGPAGMGPMTGRRAGYCAGYTAPGFANPAPGQGAWGYGRGMGFGFRGGRGGHWGGGFAAMAPLTPAYTPPPTEQQEMQALQQQAEYLAKTLDEIKNRISQLEQDKPKK